MTQPPPRLSTVRAQRATLDDLERVYRARVRQFVRIARAMTGDAELARDAVQEAFARAVRARASFRGEGSLDAWVARIVVTAARDLVRRQASSFDAAGGPLEEGRAEPVEAEPELRRAIRRLPERQRLALFLRYYADFDYRQIAEALAIERGTVSATLHAAHAGILKLLEEVPR